MELSRWLERCPPIAILCRDNPDTVAAKARRLVSAIER
jgi:hypothetical protein